MSENLRGVFFDSHCRVMRLLCGEGCMILIWTVFDWSTRVKDRQTDRQTDGRVMAYSALYWWNIEVREPCNKCNGISLGNNVFQKATAFPPWRATEKGVGSRSWFPMCFLWLVMRLPISCVSSVTISCRTPVFEKTWSATQKNVKSQVFGFWKKTLKNVKNVRSFTGHCL